MEIGGRRHRQGDSGDYLPQDRVVDQIPGNLKTRFDRRGLAAFISDGAQGDRPPACLFGGHPLLRPNATPPYPSKLGRLRSVAMVAGPRISALLRDSYFATG